MADNFGLKLGIEGEKEFKQALKEINANFKVLGSELTLVTSQFDKQDKSVDAITARNEVLNKQIAEQQNKIALLSQALESASNSFGENDQRTRNWAIQLNNAQAELNNMQRELSDNNKALEKASDGMDDAEKNADELGDEVKKAGNEAKDSGDKFEKLGSVCKAAAATMASAFAAVSAAAVACGKALVDMSREGAAYADGVITTSTQTGIATDKLQEYMYAAELVDVSTETLTKSMAKQIKSMKAVQDGTKLSVEAYDKLGVSVLNSDGTLRDSDTVYWEVIDALGKMTNESERDALAMQILGKSAQELNPLIEAGAERMNELGQQAHQAGYVMSDEMLNAYGALDDQLQYLNVGATAAKNALGTVLLPVLTDLAGDGVDLLGEFTNGILNANGDIGAMAGVVGDILPKALNSVMEYTPVILELISEVFLSILSSITENLPLIVESGTSIILSLISGISSCLPQVTSSALVLIETLSLGLLEQLPSILQVAIEVVLTLALGISEALPNLIPAVISAVVTMASVLIENLDLILDAGMQLLVGLTTGICDALPILIDALPVLIDGILNFLLSNGPKLLQMGIELTLQLSLGLIKAIPQLVSKIPQIISSIVSALGNGLGSMATVGKNLLEGLWNGISNIKDWLVKKIKSLGSTITAALKQVLGINSPSKVFEDEIGVNLGLGVGVGFEKSMAKVSKDMQNAIPTDFDVSASIHGAVNSSSGFGGISLTLNIENFNNNSLQDIRSIAEEISTVLATQINRKAEAF